MQFKRTFEEYFEQKLIEMLLSTRRAADPYKVWRSARLAETAGFETLEDDHIIMRCYSD